MISIGSPRSNRLTDYLIAEFFGKTPPFSCEREGASRFVRVGRTSYENHAVICYRRLAREKRVEIIVAGDSSATTMAAAREIVAFHEPALVGEAVAWALLSVNGGTCQFVDGYPQIFRAEKPR